MWRQFFSCWRFTPNTKLLWAFSNYSYICLYIEHAWNRKAKFFARSGETTISIQTLSNRKLSERVTLIVTTFLMQTLSERVLGKSTAKFFVYLEALIWIEMFLGGRWPSLFLCREVTMQTPETSMRDWGCLLRMVAEGVYCAEKMWIWPKRNIGNGTRTRKNLASSL